MKGLPQVGLELNKKTVISSDEALVLEKAPKSMAIVGAGAVGCEFADVFNAFGTQVTLIEVAAEHPPARGCRLSRRAGAQASRSAKIDVLTGAKIANVKVGKDSVTMTVEAGGAEDRISRSSRCSSRPGARPSSRTIGLKEAGVQLTERGFIKINEQMETSAKGIYAIGDVAGPPMLAHKGSREGVALAEHARGQARASGELRQHPERDVLPPGGRVDRTHRAAVQGEEARVQGRASSPSPRTAARARRARPTAS